MRSSSAWILLAALAPASLPAQEAYKVEAIKTAPPASISPEIGAVLQPGGYRVLDDQGKPFAELWLRKSIPAASQPAGPKGVIQFPFLQESELLGVMNLLGEAHDYRDQAIAKGVYTMRYGLQPVNGDHLGVSPFRDYVLLLPADKDKAVGALPRKQLETQSSESAGSSHPAVFFMLAAPTTGGGSPVPAMIRDEEKNTWRVLVPLDLAVKGEAKSVPYPVTIILVGASEGA
ncbi:MAG: hypothetical protein U0790_20720 [Isosphaeraceae bacterium]